MRFRTFFSAVSSFLPSKVWSRALALTLALAGSAAAQFGDAGAFSSSGGAPARGKPPEVKASLHAAATAAVAGKPLEAGLKLEHPPHWHTYWINPGLGSPTKIEWKLPEGWKAGEFLWPIPVVKKTELGNQYLMEGETWLFTTITPPADLPAGQTVTLSGSVSWLLCDEGSQCVPGGGEVSLQIITAAESAPVPEVDAQLTKVRAQQPVTSPAWKTSLKDDGTSWTVTVEPGGAPGGAADPGDVYFFDTKEAISNAEQKVSREGGVIRITVEKGEKENAGSPVGYVRASKGWMAEGSVPALAVGAAGETGPAGPASTPTAAPMPVAATPAPAGGFVEWFHAWQKTFTGALVGLFLAGMLLNLMPCVFPVLAIKVQGFVRQAGHDRGKTLRHALAYTAGLLAFVWLLAGGSNVATKAFNLSVAWGDITRYNGVLAGVVVLLFLLGLNLAGLFEIGTSLTSVGGDLQDKSGYAGSFWSGALTTVVSTPCSGPLMAVPVGFALQQGPFQQFILFTSFGLGIALPFVVLCASPRLLKKLPRPGAWMETFKKALSFPMFLAAVYFLNSFMDKTGAAGGGLLLWSLVVIAVAAWIYGHWCTPVKASRTRWIGGLTALLFAAASVKLAEAATREKAPKPGADYVYKTGDLAWKRWSPEVIAGLRAEGKAIFVNFTTVGCLTCDLNEKRVFLGPESGKVIAELRSHNVETVRAKYLVDGTPEDDAILKAVQPFGISTFPFYLMYPADASRPPFVVSDNLLSPADVISAAAKATGGG